MNRTEWIKSCLASTLLEFLEITIHNVLYIRKVYPIGIFKLMKKYGVPVQLFEARSAELLLLIFQKENRYFMMAFRNNYFKFNMEKYYCLDSRVRIVGISQYPDVNNYIKQCLQSVEDLLIAEKCNQIKICFYNKDAKPIEKFVLRFSSWQEVESIDDNTLMNGLHQQMRSLLLKLVSSEPRLRPLPENATFQLHIQTTECAMINLTKNNQLQDFPWIQGEKEISSTVTKNCNKIILPVCHLQGLPVQLEIFVEEFADV